MFYYRKGIAANEPGVNKLKTTEDLVEEAARKNRTRRYVSHPDVVNLAKQLCIDEKMNWKPAKIPNLGPGLFSIPGYSFYNEETAAMKAHKSDGNLEIQTWIYASSPIEWFYIIPRGMTTGRRFGGNKQFKTESQEFNSRYKIIVNKKANDIQLRQMFSPNIIARMVGGDLSIYEPLNYHFGALEITLQHVDWDRNDLDRSIDQTVFPLLQHRIVFEALCDQIGFQPSYLKASGK